MDVGLQASEILTSSQETLSAMATIKTKLMRDKQKMEKSIAESQEDLLRVEQNIGILEQRNSSMQQSISQAQGETKMTAENLGESLKPSDPLSGKIIKAAAKYNACDDCMVGLKKAFEKEVIDIDTFLD